MINWFRKSTFDASSTIDAIGRVFAALTSWGNIKSSADKYLCAKFHTHQAENQKHTEQPEKSAKYTTAHEMWNERQRSNKKKQKNRFAQSSINILNLVTAGLVTGHSTQEKNKQAERCINGPLISIAHTHSVFLRNTEITRIIKYRRNKKMNGLHRFQCVSLAPCIF